MTPRRIGWFLSWQDVCLTTTEHIASRTCCWVRPLVSSWLCLTYTYVWKPRWFSYLSCSGWIASSWSTWGRVTQTLPPCICANIPTLTELPLSACGCRKFQIDPPVFVLIYRPCRSYHSRPVVTGSFKGTRTTATLELSTRVPRRLTTGLLISLLTSFAQHTKWKRNRWLGTEVSDVGTSSWPDNSRIRRVWCLWQLDLRISHEGFGSIS